MHRNGFTLIELLVATTLTLILLGLVVGTLTNLSRLSTRTTTVLTLHDAVAGVQRTLGERLAAVHPGCAWHAEADPGADGLWGTDDEAVSISWMASIPFRDEVDYGFTGGDQYDLTWFRLEWRAANHVRGPGLFLSRTRGKRSNPNSNHFRDPVHPTKVYYTFSLWPQPRRDRRRDLDDNDLRTIEGASPAVYGYLAPRLPGDGTDLATRFTAVLHSSFRIDAFSLGWIARNGDSVEFRPDAGFVRRSAAGAVLPDLGTAWNSPTRIVEDGVFLDARPHVLAPDSRDIAAARPALFRLSFRLRAPRATGTERSRDDVAQDFRLAIPLGPTLPRP